MTTIADHIVLDERGRAKIAGSRIKVSFLARLRDSWGWSPEEIYRNYPHLTLSQVYAAFAYYFDHQAEIDREIREGDEEMDKLYTELDKSPAAQKMRELLARRRS